MKPLILLLAVFVLSLSALRLFDGHYEWALAGRIAMSAMLLFTAIGHFAFTRGMSMMIPSFIPFKREVVWLTGVIEAAAAIGLLIPQIKTTTAWLLIVFFILMLPANINAAMRKVDYQKASFDGNGPGYLWFRVPLQVLFIAWVYF